MIRRCTPRLATAYPTRNAVERIPNALAACAMNWRRLWPRKQAKVDRFAQLEQPGNSPPVQNEFFGYRGAAMLQPSMPEQLA